jgi:chlorobactene glucosyltransferase
MELILIPITLALMGIAGVTIINVLLFPRLGAESTPPLNPQPLSHNGRAEARPYGSRQIGRDSLLDVRRNKTAISPASTPFVSILIPARNEADVIGATVEAFLRQTYASFELLILDDNSDDNTAEIARSAADGDDRLRLFTGKPLPPGWLGKNWACHQLSQVAQGEILIFCDADVAWQPDALAALIDLMERNQADLQTVWSTQDTVTWAERLTVPLMALAIMGYLPVFMAHFSPWAAFAAANGQCLAFRRHAYETSGGHSAVRDTIVEDIMLARRIKQNRLRLRMADGNQLIRCRMYHDWREVRDGYAKNILAGYGDRVVFLGLATLFHWLVFLLPWIVLLLPGFQLWGLSLILLGILARGLTAAATHQRIQDALLMPISALLMTRIAAQAVWWRRRYGGPRWKGRVIAQRKIEANLS